MTDIKIDENKIKIQEMPNLEKHLNNKALPLYLKKLDSTVHEYNEKVDDNWLRKCALVQYLCGVVSVDNYGDLPDEAVIKDWANLLNKIADLGMWRFGTLLNAMIMPIMQDKNGQPFYSFNDYRQIGKWPDPPKDRGQSVMLLTYIGVDPKFGDTADELNRVLGMQAFVNEGEIGGREWRVSSNLFVNTATDKPVDKDEMARYCGFENYEQMKKAQGF